MEPSISQIATVGETAAPSRRQGIRERLILGWASSLEYGRLTIELPSGARETFAGQGQGTHAMIKIHDLRIVTRMLLSGDIGLAESYMDGDWESPDLTALLAWGIENKAALSQALDSSWLVTLLNRLHHARRANTKRGSRRNIAAHYDLGNAFYRLWLDETMTYSAGLFADPLEPHVEAQRRKYVRLAEKLDLKPDETVLEIGCGWGGFAEIAAAEFGCRVLCLTLSGEQAAYARQRMARAGLEDRVEVRLQDYREVEGSFDKIASIEMFEAVGEENWPTYFDALKRCLRLGGRAALQVITIADARFDRYRQNPDFIQRYVFPGGVLPSPGAFRRAVKAAQLRISDQFFFGASYAESLRRWRAAFRASWKDIESLGFDARFERMWRYYLSYCEAGFDKGQIDVGQFVIERP